MIWKLHEFQSVKETYTGRTSIELLLAIGRLLQKHPRSCLNVFQCADECHMCPFPNKDKINHPCPLTPALDVAMPEAKAMTFRTPGESKDKKGPWSMVDGLQCFVDRWNVVMPASWALAPIDIRTTWLSDGSYNSNATWIHSLAPSLHSQQERSQRSADRHGQHRAHLQISAKQAGASKCLWSGKRW